MNGDSEEEKGAEEGGCQHTVLPIPGRGEVKLEKLNSLS